MRTSATADKPEMVCAGTPTGTVITSVCENDPPKVSVTEFKVPRIGLNWLNGMFETLQVVGDEGCVKVWVMVAAEAVLRLSTPATAVRRKDLVRMRTSRKSLFEDADSSELQSESVGLLLSTYCKSPVNLSPGYAGRNTLRASCPPRQLTVSGSW